MMSATQTYNKLVPEPTSDSAGYWQGLNEHKLLLQKCAGCGTIRHYPRPMCPSCHSMDSTWVEASGRGVVHSWTITHHAFHPGVRDDLPYTLATIDLAEGVRMNAQLRGVAPEMLRIGLPVRVKFETVKEGLTLPYLVADAGA
ncbi:MAG: Zn-ribbon domain-containing OB-fold protein [Rhodospirillales bacterium]|nr:Zn-ribbon domain-containing OB-fold protein [Rhodospirillales bacterium]MBN8908533.1 Zn-ribbon domain-containing OB-fold protein [Rhodospirillales bacterium]